MFVELALIAVALEASVGYPDVVYRVIGHPVTWIGRLIAWGERAWNSEEEAFGQRRIQGVALLLLLLAASLIVGLVITRLCDRLLPHILSLPVCAIFASAMLAQRSLYSHVAAVADALEKGGIEAGRQAVSMIVGRDTRELDEGANG